MENTDEKNAIRAPILALDLGQKRIGIAVCDALSISITRLQVLPFSSWKQMLRDVVDLLHRFDAQTLVIGLPLRLNGSTGDAALQTQQIAKKFARSLAVPVYLQDERLSSMEAEENLRADGNKRNAIAALVDSEAAAIILRDFLEGSQERMLITPDEQTL